MIGEHYIFLLDAYDRLGKHLFGREWTGQEIQQNPVPPPELLEASRAPLENRIARLDTQLTELGIDRKRMLSEPDLAENQRIDAALIAERAKLLSELSQMPEPDEYYQSRYAAYRRRVLTEHHLLQALRQGSLHAIMLGGHVVPDRLWYGAPGFTFYLELSLVVMPRSESGRRRAALLIAKDEFYAWLEGVVPEVVDEESPPSPKVLCHAWFRNLVKTPTNRPRKSDCLEEAREKFPGLSIRQFNRIWDNEAPAFWKSAGRPKNE